MAGSLSLCQDLLLILANWMEIQILSFALSCCVGELAQLADGWTKNTWSWVPFQPLGGSLGGSLGTGQMFQSLALLAPCLLGTCLCKSDVKLSFIHFLLCNWECRVRQGCFVKPCLYNVHSYVMSSRVLAQIIFLLNETIMNWKINRNFIKLSL